jgi:hypothetical protein
VNDELHIVDGYASVIDFQTGRTPEVTFDLLPALAGQVKKAKRTFTKEGDNALLIEDEIEANDKTRYVTWQLITQADVEIMGEDALLQQEGQKLLLDNLSHPGLQFTLISLNPPPHKLDKRMENLKRLELRIPVPMRDDSNGSISIKVQMVEK